MKNAYSAFMAFFIPFSMAVMLAALYSYFFDLDHKPSGLCFDCYGDYPLQQQIYGLLIVSLFVLSFILPFFVSIRSKPVETNEIKFIND